METPEALLRRLELKVVRPLDGLLFGDYRGVFYGKSLELAEVSPYAPGDEAERIDWPATARTGELHVRRFREERELTLWLLLDGSPSMRFGSRRRTKYALASELALTFAYIALRHGNRVGGWSRGASCPPGEGGPWPWPWPGRPSRDRRTPPLWGNGWISSPAWPGGGAWSSSFGFPGSLLLGPGPPLGPS